MVITSTSNSQVRELSALQKKARERSAGDVFVVEGFKMFREVPRERLVRAFASESFYGEHEDLLGNMPGLTLLSDRVFQGVSDTKTPQGILCVVRQYHYGLQELLGERPLLAILENIRDPGNLGTILRTAEGAGGTGVLLSAGCVDIYNPKVIRSTMGSIYRMPFYCSDSWREDLLALKGRGVTFYAAHLKGSSDYDGQDYTGPAAFLIGNESQGLTPETAALADTRIRIPMRGQVESLNAAAAASILLYEANRQRRNGDQFEK